MLVSSCLEAKPPTGNCWQKLRFLLCVLLHPTPGLQLRCSTRFPWGWCATCGARETPREPWDKKKLNLERQCWKIKLSIRAGEQGPGLKSSKGMRTNISNRNWNFKREWCGRMVFPCVRAKMNFSISGPSGLFWIFGPSLTGWADFG